MKTSQSRRNFLKITATGALGAMALSQYAFKAAAAAVGGPGRLLELKTAVEAVTGVGRPVAAGLALRDRVPVHTAVRAGVSAAQDESGQRERAGDDYQGDDPANGAHLCALPDQGAHLLRCCDVNRT